MISFRYSKDYYDWLCGIILCKNGQPYDIYSDLIYRLYLTDYIPWNEYDQSRSEDGKSLRYSYYEHRDEFINYESTVMPDHNRKNLYNIDAEAPSSILEMMIAFAKKIDDSYMFQYGEDRTPVWFWLMINSLGLIDYKNGYWDINTDTDVDYILRMFLVYGIDENDCLIAPLFILRSYNNGKCLWDMMIQWINENYDHLYNINIQDFTKKYIGG